jgi:GTPase SAR1 family protein
MRRRRAKLELQKSQHEHGLLEVLSDDGDEHVPPELAKLGKVAIKVFNTEMMQGKKRMNRVKLMFVGQERVGKTSTLCNLTHEQHNPNQDTTDGANMFVVDTKDWVKLEQQPVYPKAFDQSVASSVGNALVNHTHNELRHRRIRRRMRRVLSYCFIIIIIFISMVMTMAIYLSKSPEPTPPPTPPPTPQSYSSYLPAPSPAPTPSPAPPAPKTPSPTRASTPSPSPANATTQDLGQAPEIVLGSAAGVFTLIVCYLMYRRCSTASASTQHGLLPAEPTGEVLRKLPVDLIMAVMNGDTQEYVTFSTWDFAGQEIYYSVHSLFITPGIYVLAFNMHDARQDSKAKYLEMLSFWMNSVHSHTSDPSDYHILIVGTHLDLVDDPTDHQIISEQIENSFQECGFWCRVMQPGDFNGHLCFFPLDNTSAVPNRERSQLHAAINMTGQEFVENKNHEYPLRWLQVLDELNRKAADGVNFMYIDHPALPNSKQAFAPLDSSADQSLYSVSSEFGVGKTPTAFRALCSCLEEAGPFLHYENILIIRPQWIADILFAVVTRQQFQAQAIARLDLYSEGLQFEASALVSEILLKSLWEKFDDTPELLIDVMLHHDQMFELPNTDSAAEDRQFLVPAMLPDTKDLGEDDHGELIRLRGLRKELREIGACFGDGQSIIASSTTGSTKSASEWPVPACEPASYLVFGEKSPIDDRTVAARGFIPEGLWFKLVVRCARWAQQTDAEWSRQHLAKSIRRDVARFSFGAQQFELRLYRAQHAIRLIVLGDSWKHPMGVLQRVRSLVDGALIEHFPAVEYFIALRIEAGGAESRLVDLDIALREVERRNFATTDSCSGSASVSGLVAVDKREIDVTTCRPWSMPQDPDTGFDVFISHCDADARFACQVYDCLAKCNSASGDRVRVFLRNVSSAHTSRQMTPEAALRRTSLFVPILSIQSVSACGGVGTENIPLPEPSDWEYFAEYFAVGLTVASFLMNLISVLKHPGHSQSVDIHEWLFLASVVVPRVFNAIFIVHTIAKEQSDRSRFAVWLHQNLQAFAVVALLASLNLDNFMLLRSKFIGKKLFVVPPPISIAVVNRSRAFGIISTVCGDFPQLIIALLLLNGDGWSLVDAIALSQVP